MLAQIFWDPEGLPEVIPEGTPKLPAKSSNTPRVNS